MARFPVSKEKAKALAERMRALGVEESDLDESFVRSQGAGGQNVNKVSTCVVLVHEPTGTRVRCEEARTQGMNRFLARRLLCEKIEAERLGRKTAREKLASKIRARKRRRSRRAKKKMIEAKRRRSATKKFRKPPTPEEES
jgi:protein subunit release factor B